METSPNPYVFFDYCVVHLAMTQMFKSKAIPTSKYNFNLYHGKGRTKFFSNLLSRIAVDDGNFQDIIPIFFNAIDPIQEYYY